METVVVRDLVTDESTTGRVFVDGALFCYCLEDPVRLGVKIPGRTAIPSGRYRLLPYASPRHGLVPRLWRETPEGKMVELNDWSFVEIHAGNTARDTEGCLLFGKARAYDGKSVSRSRAACTEFTGLLESSVALGERAYLTIINPPTDLRLL